jgi:hypothetical protein
MHTAPPTPTTAAALLAVAILLGFAPGAINAMQYQRTTEGMVATQDAAPEAAAVVAVEVPDIGGRIRCTGCGTVQSIRHMETSPGLATFEFTVRMNDGSLRTSNDASAGTWLVGDRIILVGGPKVTAL